MVYKARFECGAHWVEVEANRRIPQSVKDAVIEAMEWAAGNKRRAKQVRVKS